MIRPERPVTGGGLESPAGRVATRGFATAATNAPGRPPILRESLEKSLAGTGVVFALICAPWPTRIGDREGVRGVVGDQTRIGWPRRGVQCEREGVGVPEESRRGINPGEEPKVGVPNPDEALIRERSRKSASQIPTRHTSGRGAGSRRPRGIPTRHTFGRGVVAEPSPWQGGGGQPFEGPTVLSRTAPSDPPGLTGTLFPGKPAGPQAGSCGRHGLSLSVPEDGGSNDSTWRGASESSPRPRI